MVDEQEFLEEYLLKDELLIELNALLDEG